MPQPKTKKSLGYKVIKKPQRPQKRVKPLFINFHGASVRNDADASNYDDLLEPSPLAPFLLDPSLLPKKPPGK